MNQCVTRTRRYRSSGSFAVDGVVQRELRNNNRYLCREVFDRLLVVHGHHLPWLLIEYLRHYPGFFTGLVGSPP